MPTPPSSASRLRLGARIATGGMAEVFAARVVGPAGFEKDVAVKRVLPRYAKDPVFLERFLSEARLAARLSHPNIVQIFELGDDGEDHYIVMEAVRGPTLRQLSRRLTEVGEVMPRGIALMIVRALCAGLAHAHEQVGAGGEPLRLIHRDVSPQNVLLGHEGSIKIIDFGIAQAGEVGHLTAIGRPLGKPGYMAPEQMLSSALDARTDLYAVGVVLFELLSGRRPYAASSDAELVELVCTGGRTDLRSLVPDIDDGLAALVDAALAVDMGRRPKNARAFAAALGEIIERTGHRADAPALEALLARVVPESVNAVWPVDDRRNDSSDHTKTGAGHREITLSSDAETTLFDGLPLVPVQRPAAASGAPQVLPSEGHSGVPRSVAPTGNPGRWAAVVGVAAGLGLLALVVVGLNSAREPTNVMPALELDSDAAAVDAGVMRGAGVGDAGSAAAAVVDGVVVDGVVDAAEAADAGAFVAVGLDVGVAVNVDGGVLSARPPKAPRIGQLVVETRPWSRVTLDGRFLGITPLQRDVRVGAHRLKLVNPEQGLSKEMKIVIDAGAATVVRIDLRAR